ncbi:MAG: ATP-binding protein [Candidatus Melainabacteria bacterium]|nr:ATP-binding protein [Candidatus Melainabacteria bacterium]
MVFKVNDIKELLVLQMKRFCSAELNVIREDALKLVEKHIKAHQAVVISGLRRAGKSTFLHQIAHKYYEKNAYYYINFDDDRFTDFTASDFNALLEILIELFSEKKVIFFDEIQNIDKWETFCRRLIDNGFKLYITGSNASLLSKELGTRLTGRYFPLELFPFSFEEFLRYRKIDIKEILKENRNVLDTKTRALLKNKLKEYILKGSIPEALRYPELPVLKSLYRDILYRDIATRYRIEADKTLRELSLRVFTDITSPIQFSKIKQQLGIGNVTTVTNYISYLENSWLIFSINIFDISIKRQQIAPKKIYAIDTGLVHEITFKFKEKQGVLLENLVFLHLRKKYQEVFYYKTKSNYEVDFFVPEAALLVQVSYDISDLETKEREIRSLIEAKSELEADKKFKIKKLMVINFELKDQEKIQKNTIEIIPAYEFLLS